MALVETRQGKVEGVEQGGIHVFKGVPFAAPPVGELRWRAPQPPEPWAGVRSAAEFGASSLQGQMAGALGGTLQMDAGMAFEEDCLYLNVWTPGLDQGKRPVMVWIHGGAFVFGSGSQIWYDGSVLARRGDAVIVTINYRLGALGFLAVDADGFDANVGLLDQVAALEWVRDNIEAFGGDPANVTIFGESAGGMSVGTLLGTPAAAGLFSKAIAQSGAAHNSLSKDQAAEIVAAFMDAAGVDRADPAALRALSGDEVLAAQQASMGTMGAGQPLPFQPVTDGTVLPVAPIEAIRNGSAAAVALLTGTNLDEWKLFGMADPELSSLDEAKLADRVAKLVPAGETLLEAYRASRPGTAPSDLFNILATDRVFRIPAIRMAEAQAAHQPDTFLYLFTWASPVMGGVLGSCHALEIPFVFGTYDSGMTAMFTGSGPQAAALAEAMQDAWLAFARTGRPEAEALPAWPAYEPARRATMVLGTSFEVHDDPAGTDRLAWESVI